MSWAYDVNGYPTWVPWIVGEPSAGQVPTWSSSLSRWYPATPNAVGSTLWEWNQTDASQFESTPYLDNGTGGSAPTLTVVANAAYAGGNVLRFNGNGRGTGPNCAWLATASLSTRNYRVEIEVASETNGGVGTTYAGPLYWADITAGSLYAFGAGTSGTVVYPRRIDAGTPGAGASTPTLGGSAAYPRKTTLDISGGDVVGPGPRFVSYMYAHGAVGTGCVSMTQLTNSAAIPAGWTGLTPQRFGLWMTSGGTLGSRDITRMRVIQL